MPLVSKSFSDIITFSRGTNATYFDSAGVLKYAPNNAIRNNTMVGAVAGTPGTLPTNWFTFTNITGVNISVIGTGVESGISYIDIRLDGTPSASGVYDIGYENTTQIVASNGQTWTGATYYKLQNGSLTGLSAVNHRITYRDVASALTVNGVDFTPTGSALAVQRKSITGTATNAATAYVVATVRLSLSGAAIDITLRIGLPQLEIGNTAGPAIPTSGTAYYGPRFDYNPSTLAAQGLLIEEQRTNLCLASEDFFQTGTGGVNWIWPAGLVTGNTQVAPDGTTTADTITTIGGAQSIYQSITVTASTTYTFSMFVKLGTMSAANYKLAFYDNTAATFIATDVVPSQTPTTTSWTRVTYTFTTPVGCTSVRVYPFRNSATITSSTVFIWGAQLEVGAFPTSYIPTTTTALTRAADVASVNTLSPWYNASEGTLFADVLSCRSGNRIAMFDDGSTNNRWEIRAISNIPVLNSWSGGVQDIISLTSGVTLGDPLSPFKAAAANKTNNAAISVNAAPVGTDTSCAMPLNQTRMFIGSFQGTATFLNGYLRRITYYPRRLSNAELQAITS